MQVPQELVESVRRGEPGAFEELVRQTHRSVYSLVYRIENTLVRPWVRGYVKNVFRPQSWRFLDIDLARRTGTR